MSKKAVAKTMPDAAVDPRDFLIEELAAALELCLECGGLNWSAEHDAELALRHARKR